MIDQQNTNQNKPYPNRKNIRAKFHDYSKGLYFVTICTQDKKHYFGVIKDSIMNYSKIGEETIKLLDGLEMHYPYVELCQYVVMPNHVHAIIFIEGKNSDTIELPKMRSGLSVAIGGFKQSVTMFARRNNIEFGWQSRYHDRIIRSQNESNRISEYITNNIGNWEQDCFYQ